MKFFPKRAILFSVLLFTFYLINAQNTSMGFKLGLANTHVANLGADARLGFRGGAFLTYSISRDFGITGEVNYAVKGASVGNNSNLALNYVEIPLLAQYFLGGTAFRPKVMVGPYYSFLLSETTGGTETNRYAEQDYGAVVGLGFHQRLGQKRWINADIRYNYGLAPIRGNSEQANRGLSINAGVSFPINLN